LVKVNGEIGLYEVYYHNDIPDSRTEDPITFVGDTADEVIEELQLALASITGRAVLTDDDFAPEVIGNPGRDPYKDPEVTREELLALLAKVADEAEQEKDRPVKLHRKEDTDE
jgi:hypothetical protein